MILHNQCIIWLSTLNCTHIKGAQQGQLDPTYESPLANYDGIKLRYIK